MESSEECTNRTLLSNDYICGREKIVAPFLIMKPFHLSTVSARERVMKPDMIGI